MKLRIDVRNFFTLAFLGSLFFLLHIPIELRAQNKQMVVDGIIRLDGTIPASSTTVSVLRGDSSFVKAVKFFDPDSARFGASIFTSDGFADNDPILFRVVLSPSDSFIARNLFGPVHFNGVVAPLPPQIVNTHLFRNHSPKFTSVLSATTIDEMKSFNFQFSASDTDGDTLKYKLSTGPNGVVLSDSGKLSWTPSESQGPGEYPFTVEVHDRFGGFEEVGFKITVREVNVAPLLTIPNTAIVNEDSLFILLLTATDSDIPPNKLSYSILSGIQPGMKLVDSLGNHYLKWKPSFIQAGQYNVVIKITDDGTPNLSDQKTIIITVRNVNHPPSSAKLLLPANRDTIKLFSPPVDIKFVWHKSSDPDKDDTLKYSLFIRGPGFDTTIYPILDSVYVLHKMSRLQVASLYRWSVKVTDGFTAAITDTFTFRTSDRILGAELVTDQLTIKYVLEQNYPNPFNPSTHFQFSIANVQYVTLKIYDLMGREVETLVNEEMKPGNYSITWNAEKYSSGMYLYRIQAGNFIEAKKLLLMK